MTNTLPNKPCITYDRTIQAEEKDPVRRAAVLLEVRISEAAIGECPINVEFGKALRTLRASHARASHRYADILRDGAAVLSQHIKPARRLRDKTHPEEILLM